MSKLVRALIAAGALAVLLSAGAARVLAQIGAATYQEAGKQRIYAFLTKNGNLYVNYWDGTKWQWAQQGTPPETEVWSRVSSVTYLSGKQWIHAFVRGKDNRLYSNFWDGTKWQWADHCKPMLVMLKDDPTAISYQDPATGSQQIYVFVMGEDGNLYLNYGDSSDRKWANQGKP